MALDAELLKRLMEVFTIELSEQSQIISDGLLAMEDSNLKPHDRSKYLEDMFRAAHNIKGAARGVDLQGISDIAHQLENIIGMLKETSTSIPVGYCDLSFELIDMMSRAMESANSGRGCDVDMDYVKSKVQQLSSSQTEGSRAAPPPLDSKAENEKSPETATDSNETPPKTVPSAKSSSSQKPEREAEAEKLAQDKTATSEISAQESVALDASQLKSAEIKADSRKEPARRPQFSEVKSASAPVALDQKAIDSTRVNIFTQKDEPSVSRAKISTDVDTVRLKMDKITSVDALSEEIQVSKMEMENHLSKVAEVQAQIKEILGSNGDGLLGISNTLAGIYKGFRASTNKLAVTANSLQSNVRMMRMVPASILLRPMARSVRDLARDLGKKVHFEVCGDDIELDRSVLDGIKDPLMHLLRNAIDHGIETPQQRLASKKTELGTLKLNLHREGSEIVIVIEDDGIGIDVEKIKSIALQKHLYNMNELESMEDADILNIIFRPGFSSKEIITNVSGRGVGLDVVRANLAQMKGSVSINSNPGKGTQFALRVPITLTTDHGLLVRAGGIVFAIPTTAVVKVMEIVPDKIIDVEASRAIYYQSQAIPLRSLATVLGSDSFEPASKGLLSIVLVSKGWMTVAFLVEEVIGETEIIIKPLETPLVSVKNISGGALMGSGEIIMVLDPGDIVSNALLSSEHGVIAGVEDSENDEVAARLLVVDDSITTRTLEQNILENVGYTVMTAVDGKEAWEIIQKEKFDLVVTDIQMPVMDGFELTNQIKCSEKFKQIPVIIVSSLSNKKDKERGVSVGANAYIVKGQFETNILLDVVSQLLITHGIEAA